MSVEQRLAKLEAKLKALDVDFKKRKLSSRVERLEKLVKKAGPGKTPKSR